MQFSIIYEDKNFIAVNKPAGILIHSTISKRQKEGEFTPTPNLVWGCTLVDWLVKKYPEIRDVGDAPQIRPGIVHRLDKDTSGVLIVARTQNFFEYFKNLLQNRLVKKTYIALVQGQVKERDFIIDKPIGLKSNSVKRTVHLKKAKLIKQAITEVHLTKVFKCKNFDFSLLRVIPKTGRTHQIRVHLASIGYPIVRDLLYGSKTNPFGLARQFLHAETLEFNLENNRRIRIEADLPDDLKRVLKELEI